jgi:ABC-type Mn2+/Zn2+ transport system permease subunit
VFAALLERLSRGGRLAYDAATALLLVFALALGVVLASDVFESGGEVDQLLFGSLLAIGGEELAVTGLALLIAVGTAVVARRAWLAAAFEPESSGSLGLQVRLADRLLVVAIALAAVAALSSAGALLVSAILVIPAATVRLYAGRVVRLEVGAALLALAEGLAGLWIAYELDVPPGAAIAVLGGSVFFIALLTKELTRRRGPALGEAGA